MYGGGWQTFFFEASRIGERGAFSLSLSVYYIGYLLFWALVPVITVLIGEAAPTREQRTENKDSIYKDDI